MAVLPSEPMSSDVMVMSLPVLKAELTKLLLKYWKRCLQMSLVLNFQTTGFCILFILFHTFWTNFWRQLSFNYLSYVSTKYIPCRSENLPEQIFLSADQGKLNRGSSRRETRKTSFSWSFFSVDSWMPVTSWSKEGCSCCSQQNELFATIPCKIHWEGRASTVGH